MRVSQLSDQLQLLAPFYGPICQENESIISPLAFHDVVVWKQSSAPSNLDQTFPILDREFPSNWTY